MKEQQIIQHATTKDTLTIIKIGSESFAKRDKDGVIQIQTKFLERVASNILRLRKQNQKYAIVCSGAVQMGRKSFEEDKIDWEEMSKQSLAAEGNVGVILKWRQLFRKNGIKTAQILLNSEVDNGNYIQHANQLIDAGRLVVFNENDVVATRDREKIIIAKDNDTFAGQISKDLNAQKLAIFSGIDGYVDNFGTDRAKLRQIVSTAEINKLIDIEESIVEVKSEAGTGGIVTKLEGIGIHLSQAGLRQASIVNSSKTESVNSYFNDCHQGTLFTN